MAQMEGPSDSLETSMQRSPWLTVCNVLWGNRLAATRHSVGSRPVPFDSLWPSGETFLELYNHGRMETSVYEIVKLLLVSDTLRPLEAMLDKRVITWETKFPGSVSLAHLVCALHSSGGSNLLIRDSPLNGVWEIKDHLDHDPFSVCFSPNIRKNLRKGIKALQGRQYSKNPVVNKPLTPELRTQIFHLASEAEGLYDLAILLQEYNFEVNQEKNSEGNLLLHVVTLGGLPCLAHMFYLVNYYSADITLPNDSGLTPVHIAAKIGDEKMTEVLICVFGAGVNSTDMTNKWTPLHFAARYNCPKLIDMLLERGADLRKDDSTQCIPALLAQRHSSGECLQLLEHHSKARDLRLVQQASEGTLNVRCLYPSDISLVTSDGFTLLMKAVLGNQPSIVRDLLSLPGCPKDFRQFKLPGPEDIPSIHEQSRKSALTMAAESGLSDCLRILLEAEADPTLEDSLKWLPLHYAVDSSHKECVRIILSYRKGLSGLKLAVSLAEKNGRADIAHLIREAMHRRQKEVVTPMLFEIAQNGDKDKLFQLLEDDDDVNPSNDVSDWPLYVAAGFGHLDVVKLLFESGGHVIKRHRLNLSTPLHTAAQGGHVEVVRFLLGFCRPAGRIEPQGNLKNSYLDINEKNTMQRTPLELAASQGHMDVVRLLLDHGAVTTLPDSNGCLLSCPAFCGIQFLIESRRKEQMDRIVRALQQQKPLNEFRTLWKGPSDFNLRDSHGDTVLMVAARYGRPEVVDFLLQSAVLFTPDMKIKWNYNKRPPLSPPTPQRYNDLEESLPSEMPSRRKDDYHDYRPATALESSLKSHRHSFTYRQHIHPQPHYNTDTSEDDLSSSGDYRSSHHLQRNGIERGVVPEERPRNPPASQRDMYVNVTTKGSGPCTQSGLLCLINTHDRCSALHRAVEGNQFKVIPLLLAADPNIVNIQDKNGQTALHRACHLNLKKCIQALCRSSVVSIDPLLRDVNNNLAEDLVIQPRLKKLVYNYRVKQVKDNHPTNRPLPPAPVQDSPPTNHNPVPSPSIHENMFYPPVTLQQQSPQRGGNPYQMTSPYQVTNPRHGQPPPVIPLSPLLPTMEEDMRQSDPSYQQQRNRPRYIQTDVRMQPPPRSQTVLSVAPNDTGRYNRVHRVPVRNGGANSDDQTSHYSRLHLRSSPPPIPNQNFVPPYNHSPSSNSIDERVHKLRGVAYDSDDSHHESE